MEKGEREALGWGLYRPGVLRGWKGSGRSVIGRLPCMLDGGGDLPYMGAPLVGDEKGKGHGEEGKGDGSAVEWDQRGSERERGAMRAALWARGG